MMSPEKFTYLYSQFVKGINDGNEWLKTATIDEICDANRITLNEARQNGTFPGENDEFSPLEHPNNKISDFFSNKLESDTDFYQELYDNLKDGSIFYTPNEAFRSYQDGWMKSVRDYLKMNNLYESPR